MEILRVLPHGDLRNLVVILEILVVWLQMWRCDNIARSATLRCIVSFWTCVYPRFSLSVRLSRTQVLLIRPLHLRGQFRHRRIWGWY